MVVSSSSLLIFNSLENPGVKIAGGAGSYLLHEFCHLLISKTLAIRGAHDDFMGWAWATCQPPGARRLIWMYVESAFQRKYRDAINKQTKKGYQASKRGQILVNQECIQMFTLL